MKDLFSIKQAVQYEKDYYRFRKIDGCINTALAQLWGNENVVKAMACCVDDSQCYLLLLTDQNRIIRSYETQRERKGRIFDSTDYEHSAYAYDMTGVDSNRSRCVERKVGGFLGTTYYDIIFEGQKTPLTLTVNQQSKMSEVLNAVLNNAKQYGKAEGVSQAASAPVPGGNSAIAEIRKMYEDGLIDKAEMLDLIKSLN